MPRHAWLVGIPLLLSACFGRVSDGEGSRGVPSSPGSTGTEDSPKAPVHQDQPRPSPSPGGPRIDRPSPDEKGRPSDWPREESRPATPEGGAGAGPNSGSAAGGAPLKPEEFPAFPPPPCGPECCPLVLAEVPLASDGPPLDADIQKPHLSGDGAWVLFASSAANLDGRDELGLADVFVHSLASGQTTRLTRTANEFANGASAGDAISDSGRFILFTSLADNLAPGDNNGAGDVFVHDQLTRDTLLISRGLDGGSANGRSVGRDLSADGRFAVFSSIASDLTPDDINEAWDVFVADLTLGVVERISMGPGDQQSNVFSGNHAHITTDGRYVSFHSQSDALVPGDANGAFDIFLFDRERKTTTLISALGNQGQPDGNTFVLGMSDDARYFSGYSEATNLVPDDLNGLRDVFVHDRLSGEARRVNLGLRSEEANGESQSGTLSANGRYVGYASSASNLAQPHAPGTTDSYVFDLKMGHGSRLSQDEDGTPGDADSDVPALSGSGECVVFASRASNLPHPGSGTGSARLLIRRTP